MLTAPLAPPHPLPSCAQQAGEQGRAEDVPALTVPLADLRPPSRTQRPGEQGGAQEVVEEEEDLTQPVPTQGPASTALARDGKRGMEGEGRPPPEHFTSPMPHTSAMSEGRREGQQAAAAAGCAAAAVGGGVPAAVGGGVPAAVGGGVPADGGGGVPAAVGGSVPAAVGGGVPAAVGGGMPAAVGGGVPAAVGGGMPAAVGGGVPAAVGGGMPVAGGAVAAASGLQLGHAGKDEARSHVGMSAAGGHGPLVAVDASAGSLPHRGLWDEDLTQPCGLLTQRTPTRTRHRAGRMRRQQPYPLGSNAAGAGAGGAACWAAPGVAGMAEAACWTAPGVAGGAEAGGTACWAAPGAGAGASGAEAGTGGALSGAGVGAGPSCVDTSAGVRPGAPLSEPAAVLHAPATDPATTAAASADAAATAAPAMTPATTAAASTSQLDSRIFAGVEDARPTAAADPGCVLSLSIGNMCRLPHGPNNPPAAPPSQPPHHRPLASASPPPASSRPAPTALGSGAAWNSTLGSGANWSSVRSSRPLGPSNAASQAGGRQAATAAAHVLTGAKRHATSDAATAGRPTTTALGYSDDLDLDLDLDPGRPPAKRLGQQKSMQQQKLPNWRQASYSQHRAPVSPPGAGAAATTARSGNQLAGSDGLGLSRRDLVSHPGAATAATAIVPGRGGKQPVGRDGWGPSRGQVSASDHWLHEDQQAIRERQQQQSRPTTAATATATAITCTGGTGWGAEDRQAMPPPPCPPKPPRTAGPVLPQAPGPDDGGLTEGQAPRGKVGNTGKGDVNPITPVGTQAMTKPPSSHISADIFVGLPGRLCTQPLA